MNIVDRVRAEASNALSSGRERIDRTRADRHRSQLFRELGEACYAQSKGVATSAAEIERITGAIDALDRDDPAETTSVTDAT